MTRIKQFTTSVFAILVVAAAFAAAAPAYTTPNAELNSSPSEQATQSSGYSSPNAILSESDSVGSRPAQQMVSTPNSVLGASGLVESITVPVTDGGGSGFDWGDALIGAAAALVVVLFVSGGMVVARRRRPVPGLSS